LNWELFYPKGDCCGEPLIGVQPMLCMYIAQQCLDLSDTGVEDANKSQAIAGFIGIALNRAARVKVVVP